MLLISLDWRRPADGVQVIPASDLIEEWAKDDQIIRGRTERSTPLPLRLANLEDPICIRLANSRDIDQLCNFVGRFGPIDDFAWHKATVAVSLALIEDLRETIEDGLYVLNSPDDGDRVAWAEKHLADANLRPALEFVPDDGRQRLSLRAKSLSDFMLCEIASAIEAGARSQRCAHCNNAFLTGHGTGRRSTALYCSDRCRVAALRHRNSQSEGRG